MEGDNLQADRIRFPSTTALGELIQCLLQRQIQSSSLDVMLFSLSEARPFIRRLARGGTARRDIHQLHLSSQVIRSRTIKMSKLHDSSGQEVLKIIRDNNITNEVKLHELGELKKSIKHYQIPEPSISPLFEITRLCMNQQHSILFSTGFAMLAHLLKRLHLQEPDYIIPQTGRLLPLVAERLGEAKERNRDIACQILVDIWRVCPQEVETTIRDNVMTGKSVYAKQTGMIWISKVGNHTRTESAGTLMLSRLMRSIN
jgi:hypothetical protein